jgi:hypothetical protein
MVNMNKQQITVIRAALAAWMDLGPWNRDEYLEAVDRSSKDMDWNRTCNP